MYVTHFFFLPYYIGKNLQSNDELEELEQMFLSCSQFSGERISSFTNSRMRGSAWELNKHSLGLRQACIKLCSGTWTCVTRGKLLPLSELPHPTKKMLLPELMK